MIRTSTALPALILVSSLATAAAANVQTVGPFTGDFSEGFENISGPQGHTGGMDIFGGQAHFNDALANQPWIASSLNGPEGSILPYDGNFMGLAPTGWVAIEFEAPISAFGGYFGTASINSGGSVAFLDAEGLTIDIVAFDVPALQWTWQGWESEVPVHTIMLQASENPGNTMVYDNLQMTLVPAPGAMLLMAAGLGIARRRRH